MKRSAFLGLVALSIAGCYADDPLPSPPPPPVKKTIQGDLAVEIRDTAHVELSLVGGAIEASITLSNGYGFASGALSGAGRVEPFGEAGSVLYTARFEAPAIFEGPCGGEDVSLALSLHRRGDNLRVGGALAVYCGKSVWHGVPRRVLRLSGEMPLP